MLIWSWLLGKLLFNPMLNQILEVCIHHQVKWVTKSIFGRYILVHHLLTVCWTPDKCLISPCDLRIQTQIRLCISLWPFIDTRHVLCALYPNGMLFDRTLILLSTKLLLTTYPMHVCIGRRSWLISSMFGTSASTAYSQLCIIPHIMYIRPDDLSTA